MKPKKKKRFDIKTFFVLNVEKIILILVIPLAIYFAYQGTQHEPLSWQPDALAKAADDSDQFIRNNVRKAADEGISIFTYDQYAEWIKQPIKVDLYKTDVQWLPSLFPEKSKRGATPVYTVTDLKANSGLGAIAINLTSAPAMAMGLAPSAGGGMDTGGSGANANVIGARWAVVTGLIPIKRQLAIYVEKYTNSVLPDPARDMPTYLFYDVERAEIEPGKNPNDLNWIRLDLINDYNRNIQLWSGMGQDVVDPNFLAPPVRVPMAYPLPPVAKKFGEEVTHPPVIPMLSDSQTELLQQMKKYQELMLEKMLDIKAEDVLKDSPFLGSGMRSGDSGSMGGGAVGGIRRDGTRLTQKEEEEILKPVDVTHYLFRYLDFKVEPGKTYRYRARLYLANPNYELAANFIEEESLATELFLVTDFSEPSNMVTIPLESRILATSVSQPSMAWADPMVNATAVYFDMKDGSEWYVEKNALTRGSLANFKRQEATNAALENKNTGSDMSSGSDPGSSGPPRGARGTRTRRPEQKKDDESKKTINIVSEVCILDITGGIRLPKAMTQAAKDVPDMYSPGKILVLEPSGNMLIRSVNTDLIEMEGIKNPKQGGIMGGSGSMGMGMDYGSSM